MSRKLLNFQFVTQTVLFLSLFLFEQAQAWSIDPITLSTFKTHSRITIQIDGSVPFKKDKTKKGFQIEFQGISLSDLGVSLGEKARWSGLLKQLHDSRLISLQVKEKDQSLILRGLWKFPAGKHELADPQMEWFDSQAPQNSQLFLDFWYRPGPTVIQKREDDKKAQVTAFLKKLEQEGKKRIARQLASTKILEDGELKDSCQHPLTQNSHVFVQFLPSHSKVDFSHWFSALRPDEGFSYLKPRSQEADHLYVRLALRFYETGKTALALRTLEFFGREFPRSSSQDQMRFLKANALIKLGLHTEAEVLLKQIMTETRGSPLALYSAKYLTRRLLDQDSYLLALQNFLWLAQNYPHHEENWVFHLGSAEMLYQLGETDRAAKEYQWVVEKATDRKYQAEAAYRMGDLYLARQQFEQALLSYYHANQYFKEERELFPEQLLNQAEVYYQLEQWDQAQSLFEGFLRQFSHLSAGWKATLRLAEIAARDPKSKGEEERSYRNRLYETINRYPYSPGGILARLALLPCGDHGKFDRTTALQFLLDDKGLEISPREIVSRSYREFKTLSKVRSLILFSEYQPAWEVALKEHSITQSPNLKKALGVLSHEAFRRRVHQLLKANQNFEALSEYAQTFKKLPAVQDASDLDYLIRLSEVASDLGLSRVASELIETYHQRMDLNRLPASAQTDPTPLSIKSLLQESEQHFARAKSMWSNVKEAEPQDGTYHAIRVELSQVRDDSAFAYEKELLLGLMDERQSKLAEALSHVLRAQLLKKSLILDSWIASLELKMDHQLEALSIYENLEKRFMQKESLKESASDREKALGLKEPESLLELYLVQAKINEQLGHWQQAQRIYEKALRQGYESNRVRFFLARCLYQSGNSINIDHAKDIFQKMIGSKSTDSTEEFWRGLAAEVLSNQAQANSILNQAKEGK